MPGGLIEPLPRNLTDTTRVLVRLPGAKGVANHPLAGELAGVSVEAALPIRRFYSWKGKRNYEGRWWCSTSGGHVEFESLLERDALMIADFDVDIFAVAAQPLAFLWPRHIKGSTYHVPDFFVRLSNGDGRIVDVKRHAAVGSSEAQFALTRAACNEIGWQYEVFTGDSADLRQERPLAVWLPPGSVCTSRRHFVGNHRCFHETHGASCRRPTGG